MFGRKSRNSVVVSSMIGALTALTVGGILIVSAMYCDPVRELLLSVKKGAKQAYKAVEDATNLV